MAGKNSLPTFDNINNVPYSLETEQAVIGSILITIFTFGLLRVKKVKPGSEKVIDVTATPVINNEGPTRALVFDSYFDPYRGVILLVKVVDGIIKETITTQITKNNQKERK